MAKEYSGQYIAQLKAHASDGTKSYLTYDVSSRLEFVYTAYTEALNGTICLLTQYVYADPSSNRVVKMKESISTWSSAYDI